MESVGVAMSVSGRILVRAHLSDTDISAPQRLRGSFNKAIPHDQIANPMCVSHSTRCVRSPALQLIIATCDDLWTALAEAEAFHILSLWRRLDVTPWLRERPWVLIALFIVAVVASAADAVADDIPTKAPPIFSYDWTGFYLGAHLGYAGGDSNWTASPTAVATPSVSGSLDLLQRFDPFNEAGSFFGGFQAGYNYMLPNRFVIGAEVDASFPAWPNLAGISIGGTSTFSSPAIGAESYSDTLLYFGAVRGRIGYAFGDWLWRTHWNQGNATTAKRSRRET
jgi:hypothetical protein